MSDWVVRVRDRSALARLLFDSVRLGDLRETKYHHKSLAFADFDFFLWDFGVGLLRVRGSDWSREMDREIGSFSLFLVRASSLTRVSHLEISSWTFLFHMWKFPRGHFFFTCGNFLVARSGEKKTLRFLSQLKPPDHR
jgi:hypothetical protein